ncbi:choice-of-anchor D domain-containing protein [Kaarinaea lacus]
MSSSKIINIVTVVFLLFAVALPVHSANFTVDSLLDNADAFVGDNVCDDGSGACTLRAAIQEANVLSGDDYIDISVTGTITLASALPAIVERVSITGPGADQLTVSGANAIRPFQISTTNVKLTGLTISDGRAITGSPPRGGGIYIETGAALTLEGVVVSNNMAISGGGIYTQGTLSLNRSTVSDNQISQSGSYVFAWGGGILIEGAVLTINNSTISGNSSTAVGGVQAYALGSGVSSLDSELIINNSTISGNVASASGGSSNNGAHGGGIYAYAGSNLSMLNSTVSSNTVSATGAGITEQGAGVHCCDNGIFTLTNSIVSGNTSTAGIDNCYRLDAVFDTNYNIEDAATCGLTGIGDQSNTDPLLEALGDNGGLTQTHHLQGSSPAIDTGSDVDCPATDQRGVTRPVDGDAIGGADCDIGAVEYSPSAILVVNPDNIDFGLVYINSSSADRMVTLGNSGAGALEVTALDLSGPDANDFTVDPGDGSSGSCGPTPITLDFLSDCTVALAFAPGDVGDSNAQLDISSNSGTRVVTLMGNGSVQPVPGILISPEEADFGTVTGSDAVEKYVYVLNEGSADLQLGTIGAVDLLEDPFSISADECSNTYLQPGTFCKLTVRFDPGAVPAAVLVSGLSIAGLLIVGMLNLSGRNSKLWLVILMTALVLGAILSSCHSDGGGGPSITVYTDSFDIPSNDPDTATLTVNVKASRS